MNKLKSPLKSPVIYSLLIALSGFVMWAGHSGHSSIFKQLGGLALVTLVVASPIVLLLAEKRSGVSQKICRLALGSLTFAWIFFATGELALRLLYWEGESFSTRFGPMVQRFERDFQYNRYDGPSRGPGMAGSNQDGVLRVLVQGDSITWGQGVKDEEALYTTRLLSAFRQRQPDAEMAVLAKPGREIDGHIEQLLKWGKKTQPDIIVYQWYINDVEVDKSRVPKRRRLLWQKIFVHAFLVRNSYFWFFVDYHLTRIFPTSADHDLAYQEAYFAPESEGWTEFAELFTAWSKKAKALTPRVLVFLYPLASKGPLVLPEPVEDIHGRVHELCAANTVTCVEAIDWFQSLGSYRDLWASPYDQHPNEQTHEVMASALEDQIAENWPELFH